MKQVSGVMGPVERAERIIDLAIQMVELLRTENRLMDERRYTDLAETLPEKTVLLNNYDAHMAYVAKHKDFPLSLDADLLGDMLESTRLLQVTAEDNRQRLQDAIDAGELMLDMVVQAAKSHSADLAGYDAQGASRTKATQSTPITLDRRL